MTGEYKIVYQGGEDEVVVKKSRFIRYSGVLRETEEQALAIIEAMRKNIGMQGIIALPM